MALASFVQTNFLGGEISQSAQGRMERPDYKTALNVCLNAIPVESAAWMRRPGTRHVAPTRGGKQGRLISFSFAQSFPYVMEFTDGFMRFTTGPSLVTTNDNQTVTAISSANPAKVTTSTAHGWSSGNTVQFPTLSADALLQNRQFSITVVDTTNFTIADAVTGAAIDGSTLGAFGTGTVARVLEIATPYLSNNWSSLRSVQAETRSVLLNGTVKPEILQVATQPSATAFASFTLAVSDFIDGPYLDPIAGSIATPTALTGLTSLTFSYQAYEPTRAYNVGDFVTSGSLNYKSLTALNLGNLPVSHPANWLPINGGAAINNGQGFVASDIGRQVRLLSEPAQYVAGNSYSIGSVVAYPAENGVNSYWTATTNGVLGQPGTTASWVPNATGALWTWGQITSLSGSGLVPVDPANAIGNLTGGGGTHAAFDGNTSKLLANSAITQGQIFTSPAWSATTQASGGYPQSSTVNYGGTQYVALIAIPADMQPPTSFIGTRWRVGVAITNQTFNEFVGQHFAAGQQIYTATVWWPTNNGGANLPNAAVMSVNLRGSFVAPASPANGVLLGGQQVIGSIPAPLTILSNDLVTAYTYLWIEIVASYGQPLPDDGTHEFQYAIGVAQVQFFASNITNGSVITVQLRGPALLYSQPIRTWRLGLYSDTTGWPTCGTYHEGRLWLGGVVSNRFDASVSNGINGVELDFTPTSVYGAVADNNAISYVCDGEDVNQLLWMTPDQQGVLFGTQSSEWLISAPSQGALAPTNIKAVRVTKNGCANIEPRRSEHTLLVVQRFARKITEYFADVFSGKFTAPNLSERAKHLTVSGIKEIAYQQELAPIVWGRRGDGALVGATYKRDTLTTSQGPTIIGWHRHQLGSSRVVESICVGPSVGGNLDTLSLITNDVTTGIRHIELMTDLLDEGFQLTDCWFLDDAIVPSSSTVQLSPTGGPYGALVLNGLSVHNGKTVTAFICGLDCGDFLVTNGAITVPFGDGVSGGAGSGLFTLPLVQTFTTLPAVVGFTYNSDGQIVRPLTPGDPSFGFAKLTRNHRASALLYGVVNGSISFGSTFSKMYPAKLLSKDGRTPYTVQQLWSGIWRDNAASDYDFDGMVAWRISRPLPAFVIAAGGFDAKQDA